MESTEEVAPAKLWYDVGIPGLKNAMSPENSKAQRIAWASAIVICFVACIFQFVERIQFFQESSISTVIRIDVDQTMTHPRMTICPAFYFENDMTARRLKLQLAGDEEKAKTLDMCDLLSIKGMTVEKLWDMTGNVNVTFSMDYWDFFGIFETTYKSKDVKSFYGICKTILVDQRDVVASSRIYFFTDYHDPPPVEEYAAIYRVMFHDEEVISDLELAHGTDIPTWKEVRTIIEPTKFQNLNAWQRRCISNLEHFQCKRACIENRLRDAVKCKLPFMSNHPEPFCDTVEKCKDAMATVKQIYKDTEKKNPCPCTRACYYTKYSVIPNYSWDDQQKGSIVVGFRSATMQTMEEYPAFDVVALVCCIGGIIGLFLGFSLLSLMELGESFLGTLKTVRVAPVTKKNEEQVKRVVPSISERRRGFNVIQPISGPNLGGTVQNCWVNGKIARPAIATFSPTYAQHGISRMSRF